MKRINQYERAYDIMRDYYGVEVDLMSEEARETMQTMDDYSGFCFYVVDDEVITCDVVSGDVISSESITDFRLTAITAVWEMMKN